MEASINAAKAQARKTCFAARKQAHGAGLDAAAQAHLRDVLSQFASASLAGYMPIRTEIDPLPVMAEHLGPVGVPVIRAEAQPLDFHLWTHDCEMVDGPFGARVPAQGVAMVPRVVIVPLVGFDPRGYRLGYGGGFYDRTLAGLKTMGPVTTIGYAYEAQQLDEVPIDQYDQKLDLMVTETGVREFK